MDLAYRTFFNARVQAFTKLVGMPGNAFIGGPVLDDPADNRLRHQRHGIPYDGENPGSKYEQVLDHEWNYIGPVYSHFGHVMAEMVHRILPSMLRFECRNWLAVAHTGGPTNYADLPPAYRSALDFFGIGPDNLRVINRNSLVSTLNIAEQGSHFGGGPKPGYLDMLAAYSHKRLDELCQGQPTSGKLYVSRSEIPHGGNFLGESYIQSLLAAEGFEIFHPEHWPLPTQMHRYRTARQLIFPEGSACHGTELLGSRALGQVYVLLRRADHFGSIGAVLRPRATEIDFLTGMPFLGTVRMHPVEMRLLPELGVSAFDLDGLVRFLRKHGLAEFADLQCAAYFEAASSDLEAYFRHHINLGSPVVGPEDFDAIRTNLETLKMDASSNALNRGYTSTMQTAAAFHSDLRGEDYHRVLSRLHDALKPNAYFEIGVAEGGTMALARCASIGIDPNFGFNSIDLVRSLTNRPALHLFRTTSDDFFNKYNPTTILGAPIDLAFLDGMHRCEFLLRDFINVEKHCRRGSLIVLHDCVPVDVDTTTREHNPPGVANPAHMDWWLGDVWRTALLLKRHRRDLTIAVLDAFPSGLVCITGLNPSALMDIDACVREMMAWSLSVIGLDALHEELGVTSTDVIASPAQIAALFAVQG